MFDRFRSQRRIQRAIAQGHTFAASVKWAGVERTAPSDNPLKTYSQANRTGPGIWKWDHYFDAYHRHFQEFRGRSPRVLEIGVYSGGSLNMWADYFGPGAEIIGVDIEPACKAYERPGVEVLIGDQSDRAFWTKVRETQRPFDIVIDDGGHQPQQQVPTFEETLPHLAPGGVFVCEDVVHEGNLFAEYIAGLIRPMNAFTFKGDAENPDRALSSPAAGVQSVIESVTTYPFMVVVKKRQAPVAEFVAAKRGSEWQPFLY